MNKAESIQQAEKILREHGYPIGEPGTNVMEFFADDTGTEGLNAEKGSRIFFDTVFSVCRRIFLWADQDYIPFEAFLETGIHAADQAYRRYNEQKHGDVTEYMRAMTEEALEDLLACIPEHTALSDGMCAAITAMFWENFRFDRCLPGSLQKIPAGYSLDDLEIIEKFKREILEKTLGNEAGRRKRALASLFSQKLPPASYDSNASIVLEQDPFHLSERQISARKEITNYAKVKILAQCSSFQKTDQKRDEEILKAYQEKKAEVKRLEELADAAGQEKKKETARLKKKIATARQEKKDAVRQLILRYISVIAECAKECFLRDDNPVWVLYEELVIIGLRCLRDIANTRKTANHFEESLRNSMQEQFAKFAKEKPFDPELPVAAMIMYSRLFWSVYGFNSFSVKGKVLYDELPAVSISITNEYGKQIKISQAYIRTVKRSIVLAHHKKSRDKSKKGRLLEDHYALFEKQMYSQLFLSKEETMILMQALRESETYIRKLMYVPLEQRDEAYKKARQAAAERKAEAASRLLGANLQLISGVVRKRTGYSKKMRMDRIIDGCEGFLAALDAFDETKGDSLQGYALKAVENEVDHGIRRSRYILNYSRREKDLLAQLAKTAYLLHLDHSYLTNDLDMNTVIEAVLKETQDTIQMDSEELRDMLKSQRVLFLGSINTNNDEKENTIEMIEDPSYDPDTIFRGIIAEEIEKGLRKLNNLEENILREYYGIDSEKMILKDIANKHGRSMTNIRIIRTKAERRLKRVLKQSKYYAELKDYVRYGMPQQNNDAEDKKPQENTNTEETNAV
ncbi:MAG: hypothetical protein IKS37_10225 [Solobacterium sp.]|nr:hypothetical protein [Solobacterium sp.]